MGQHTGLRTKDEGKPDDHLGGVAAPERIAKAASARECMEAARTEPMLRVS